MVNVWNVDVFTNELCPHGGIRLSWEGDAGFGQCDLIFKNGYNEDAPEQNFQIEVSADTECMCDNNNKEFLKELFESLINHINVIG